MKYSRFSIVLALAAGILAGAEIIDRIAVTVDRHAITESEILEHIRAAAFLNGEKPDLGAESRKAAAERLVDLVLIRNEITVSGFRRAPAEEAVKLFEQLRQERYKEPGSLEGALAESGLDAADVQRVLYEQLTLLRFVDFRFEAGILLTEAEVERYYETRFVPKWKEQSKDQPPPLDDVREKLEAELADERGDQALEDWLKAERLQHRVLYREEVFR